MSLKNPVTPPGIDPGTVRLVAQRINHYATPGPKNSNYIKVYFMTSAGDFIIIPVIKECGVIIKFWSHNVRGTDRLGQLGLIVRIILMHVLRKQLPESKISFC